VEVPGQQVVLGGVPIGHHGGGEPVGAQPFLDERSDALLVLHDQDLAHAGISIGVVRSSTGSSRRKVAPLPGSDSTRTRPPSASAMASPIARPTPAPPFPWPLPWANGWQ